MQISVNYTSKEKLKLSIPNEVSIVNNFPDRFYKKLSQSEISNIIRKSILSESSFKNKKIAIVIEDIDRPTYLGDVLKKIIDKLLEKDAKKDKLSIISATGAHRPMQKADFFYPMK